MSKSRSVQHGVARLTEKAQQRLQGLHKRFFAMTGIEIPSTQIIEAALEAFEFKLKKSACEKCPHGNDLVPGEDARCGCRGPS
jgi:hypothetical protein